MNRFMARALVLTLLACGISSVQRMNAYENEDCCRPSCCYECSCNPLYCGAWDLELQAGVAPITWNNRGDFSLVQCVAAPAVDPVNLLFEVPQFHKFFHVPWTVGGQVGYHLSDNVRAYLEFNYVQASAKKAVSLLSVAEAPINIVFSNEKYKLFDAYIGARYYFDRWCDTLSFFLGVKAGLTHHKRTRFDSTILLPLETTPITFTSDLNLFNNRTSPSGGLNLGLDYCICGCWSVVLTGEVVASCGPKSNGLISFNSGTGCATTTIIPGVNNLLIGGIGTELRFPVTLGVRYSF